MGREIDLAGRSRSKQFVARGGRLLVGFEGGGDDAAVGQRSAWAEREVEGERQRVVRLAGERWRSESVGAGDDGDGPGFGLRGRSHGEGRGVGELQLDRQRILGLARAALRSSSNGRGEAFG
ncbi:hypothetical protein [Nannocystis radixulma]|uniref:hypothetical protein n=1 Tax=Nannocystis radixulma TaxID=2995305 RepID=UPI00232CC1D1|nr:hypothetical protein [Nannocystis radixulma]